MRKRIGFALIALGVLSVIAAIVLLARNYSESRAAGVAANERAEALAGYIEADVPAATPTAADVDEYAGLDPVVFLDGYDYIGSIQIPDLKLSLPVMATWDYEKLRLSPCRHFGAAKDGDLVIAAHNYPTHFGRIGALDEGDSVRFTGVDGTEYNYSVAGKEIISPDEVSKVESSGHALVLYTCTRGGAKRVVVYCDLETNK